LLVIIITAKVSELINGWLLYIRSSRFAGRIPRLTLTVAHPKGAAGIDPFDNASFLAHYSAGAALQTSGIIKRNLTVVIQFVQHSRTNVQTGLAVTPFTYLLVQQDMWFFLIHIEPIQAEKFRGA
jgi:hypothetical protein